MNKVKVLLVDDEYFNYEMLSAALGERFDVHYVATGQEALSYSVGEPLDVLILDVCMPGLDGYDICRLLKNTPETQHLPILMLSGLESDDDRKEGFNAGCDDYLTKPFDISLLKEKLEALAR